jgi:hypothetical protein
MYVPCPPNYWYPPPQPQYFVQDYRPLSLPKVAPSTMEPRVEGTEAAKEQPSGVNSEIESIRQQISRIKQDLDNLEKRVPKPTEKSGGLGEAILRLNGAIRYVAILDSGNNLLEFKSREEDSNLTLREATKDFTSISPLIMLGALERLRPFYGNVNYIAARLEEGFLIVFEATNRHFVLILESAVNTQLADQIAAALQELILQV